jgi:hypothetical protein
MIQLAYLPTVPSLHILSSWLHRYVLKVSDVITKSPTVVSARILSTDEIWQTEYLIWNLH